MYRVNGYSRIIGKEAAGNGDAKSNYRNAYDIVNIKKIPKKRAGV